jgi:hypothetical protein
VKALAREAQGRGVSSIHADVLGEDHQLVTILGRVGNASVTIHDGNLSVDIDLPTAA